MARERAAAEDEEDAVNVEIKLGGLKPFKVLGGLVLYAPSPADASAEAHSNEEGQVYFGRGAISLREGAPRAPRTPGPVRGNAMPATCGAVTRFHSGLVVT